MPFDFDDHANLAIATVAAAPSPPDSGVSLTVTVGQGARFYRPPPFNVTIWPAGQFPDPTNAEVARCTAIAGDVLTLVRAAEPPAPARTVLVGDLIAETVTAKSLIDIENAIGTLDSSVTSLEGDVNTLQNVVASGPVALHAPTHAEGGTDPVQLTQSQVTGLTTSLTTIEGDVNTLEGAVNTLQTDVTAIEGDVNTLETTVNVHENEINNIEGDVNTLQNIVATGPVALHAPTHANGGTDPVTITTLAGYPGGTVNFLRADGTFALPAGGGGGGMPDPHASTHEVGGSDPIDGALSLTEVYASKGLGVGITSGLVPGQIYTTGTVTGFGMVTPDAGYFAIDQRLVMRSPVDGVLRLTNAAQTDFSLLQFGGTTAAFPALKRSGTELHITGANGAGYLPLRTAWVSAEQGQVYVGAVGVVVTTGAGSPEGAVAAPVGSLCLRGDGGTATTLYVKETGAATSTGWVAHGAGGGGMPAAHATTHNTGGSDPLTALSAAILTSGSLPFARVPISAATRLLGRGSASGAGAMQELTLGTGLTMTGTVLSAAGGGAPAAHQASHQIGGSDVLANNAWTNQANTFTQTQTFTSPFAPALVVQATVATQQTIMRIGSTLGAQSADVFIAPPTADGADNNSIYLCGGGHFSSDRGSSVVVRGNDHGVQPGQIYLSMGDAPQANILFGHSGGTFGQMHRSGGFIWGNATDPGAGSVGIEKNLAVGGTFTNSMNANAPLSAVFNNSNDGTSAYTVVNIQTPAASMGLYVFPSTYSPASGNMPAGSHIYCSGGGGLSITAAGGNTRFYAAGTLAGTIFTSGGLGWGGGFATVDPGAGFISTFALFANKTSMGVVTNAHISVLAATASGYDGINVQNNIDLVGGRFMQFFNASGVTQGNIHAANASTTAFATTSDQRMKQDRGVLITTDVLSRLVVHDFIWTTDGAPGRGLFAQEAAPFAPFAVDVGTDEVTEAGHLKQPWGIDYSKFVPDLIAGWQQHHAELKTLKAQLAQLLGKI